jgi:hypothetical protein
MVFAWIQQKTPTTVAPVAPSASLVELALGVVRLALEWVILVMAEIRAAARSDAAREGARQYKLTRTTAEIAATNVRMGSRVRAANVAVHAPPDKRFAAATVLI